MKSTSRFSVLFIVILLSLAITSPGIAQAEAPTLSPGVYFGRFYYTNYLSLFDNQNHGDVQTVTFGTYSIEIKGTIEIQVDKNGAILPGAIITPESVTFYTIREIKIIPSSCNVMGYMEGETSATITQKTTSAFDPADPSFEADINVGDFTPINFKKTGTDDDCKGWADRNIVEGDIKANTAVMNKIKTMKFTILFSQRDSIHGSIHMKDFTGTWDTPGGTIVQKDPGTYFNLYIDDRLAPLIDDPKNPPAEWRTK